MSDFKPGDKVTSPLLVGEWEVASHTDSGWIEQRGQRIYVSPIYLTLVAPPLPPEPAVGEVVFVNGVLWHHDGRLWYDDHQKQSVKWSDIAADADRAVPEKAHRAEVVAEVVAWLRSVDRYDADHSCANDVEREFGGDDE